MGLSYWKILWNLFCGFPTTCRSLAYLYLMNTEHVPELIVGTMRWGSWGSGLSTKQMQELILGSLESGLNWFDLADIYGDYTTQGQVGKALSSLNVERENYRLISKVGIELPGKKSPYPIKSYNYTREHIFRTVDNSLRELKTEYLDLLLLHRPSPLMDCREIGDSFQQLRQNQKVRAFGVSNFSFSQYTLLKNEFKDLGPNQVEISLCKPEFLLDGRVEQFMCSGTPIQAYSPVNGVLQMRSQRVDLDQLLKELEKKYQADWSSIVLAFLLTHPAGIRPVVGTTSLRHLKTLFSHRNLVLERRDWFSLLEVSLGEPVP